MYEMYFIKEIEDYMMVDVFDEGNDECEYKWSIMNSKVESKY